MLAFWKKKLGKLSASAPSLSQKIDLSTTETPSTTINANHPASSAAGVVAVPAGQLPSTKPPTNEPTSRPLNRRSCSTGDLKKLASARSHHPASTTDSNRKDRSTGSRGSPSQRSRAMSSSHDPSSIDSWRKSVILPASSAPDFSGHSSSWKRSSVSNISQGSSSGSSPAGRNSSTTSPQTKRSSINFSRNGPGRRTGNEPNQRFESESDRRRSFAPEAVAAAAKSDAFYQRSVEETRREEKIARLRNAQLAVSSKPTAENVEVHAYFQNNIVHYRKESEEGRRRANLDAMIQATVPTVRPSSMYRSASNEQAATLSRQQMGQPLIIPELSSDPTVDWPDAYGMPSKRGHGERRHSYNLVGSRNQDALRAPPPLFY